MSVQPQLLIDGGNSGLRICLADTWWRRAIGLLATARLDDPVGLWITPCNSVHMVGMRYAIDVAYLDADGRVLKLVRRLKPWRFSYCHKARTALELRAGLIDQLRLRLGQSLKLCEFPHG